jgi:WD40 repeat protein
LPLPATCSGFLRTQILALASVWGGYNGKHAGPVTALAFAPDGKILYSASADDTLKAWAADSGEELRSWPHPDAVTGVAVSKDGLRLASTAGVEQQGRRAHPQLPRPARPRHRRGLQP